MTEHLIRAFVGSIMLILVAVNVHAFTADQFDDPDYSNLVHQFVK